MQIMLSHPNKFFYLKGLSIVDGGEEDALEGRLHDWHRIH